MVDTQRSEAELLSIFADGQAAGSITAQDVRDLIISTVNKTVNDALDARVTVVEKEASEAVSTTLLTGGLISINADPTKIDIAAGSGRIVDASNPGNIISTAVSWNEQLGISVTNIGTVPATFLSIDINGDVVQSINFPTGVNLRNKIHIGTANHADLATVSNVSQFTPARAYQTAVSLTELIQALGVINMNGNLFSGAPAGNLSIAKTEGNSFYFGFQRDPQNPNIINSPALDTPAFISAWRDGVGGFSFNQPTVITAGVYDANTGGASAPNGTLTTNNWTNHRILFSPDAGLVGIIYGQYTYASSSAAIAAIPSESMSIPPSFVGVPVRGAITMRGGATNLTNTGDAIFTKTNKLGEF